MCGIYTTNFAEYDKLFIITDIRTPQKLNNWNDNEVSRLEIWTKDFEQVDATTNEIYFTTANRPDSNQTLYQTQSIKELVPQIFEWLNLLDMNAWIILVLMFAVAGFNMISGLLILILERTNTIGVLKALGVTDWNIRKLFLYQSVFLIGKGMMWGNLIGVGLVIIEYFFHVIPLDPLMYYVSYVPVTLNIGYWLLINIVVAIVSVGILILPSYLITKISPAKSIKFD
ncbi:MAG TPA: FtsX-like permease family protein [Paludibacteraceae bacterium]|nr:FtsX-like permease family protein [Paludibacteraceae bacterium]